MSSPVKINITLYNREYVVNCDPGQEDRLREIVSLVEHEMAAVGHNVGNATENRHLMLTCLSLADKLLEARNLANDELNKQEDLFVAAVDHLRDRIAVLATHAG